MWIGGDSRSTSGNFIWPLVVEKWFRADRWRIGVTGNARTLGLVRNGLASLATLQTPDEIGAWLMEAMREAGYANTRKEGDAGTPHYEQGFLIACRDGVWHIGGDGVVSAPAWGFFADGSGADYAYGAAWAAAHYHHVRVLDAEKVVRLAIYAAAAFDTGTGGNFLIERVE